MPSIIACYKWVTDEADIKINPDLSIDTSKAKGKISDYDRNAIEAAVQSAKKVGSRALGLTFGTADAKQSIKDALSRGPEEAVWINAKEAANADGAVTSKALSAAIQKIDDVILVICAEGASDTYSRQTAPRIGADLDWPVVSSVSKFDIDGNVLTAVRKLEDVLQTVKVELPAVISVLPEVSDAPIPGLKAVMAASKKPVRELTPDDLGIDFNSKIEVTATKGYEMNRKNIILEGEASEKVAQLVEALRKEGVF